MGHCGVPCGGLNILGVHLGAHPVLREQVPQRHRIGQVHEHAGGRGGRGGNGGQADILLVNAHAGGERRVDGVLHHQLRHHLPRLPRSGVGVVCAVDLGHARPSYELFRLAGVHKGADHIDIAVNDIVLGVLVDAVDALLGKHHRHLRSGHAGDIGVVVDGTAHFIFNQVQGLPLGADLLAGDGHAADPLGGTLNQTVEVGLSGGADDHDVVRAVVGGHAHTADVVLKAARGNLGGDGGNGLGVDVVEVVGRHQAHALPAHGLGNLPVDEGTRVLVLRRFAPDPVSPPGAVLVQVLQNFLHVNALVHLQFLFTHALTPPSKRPAARSHSFPSARAAPASRMDMFSALDRR